MDPLELLARHTALMVETAREITDPRVYRIRMSLLFGIDLSVEDVAALGIF